MTQTTKLYHLADAAMADTIRRQPSLSQKSKSHTASA